MQYGTCSPICKTPKTLCRRNLQASLVAPSSIPMQATKVDSDPQPFFQPQLSIFLEPDISFSNALKGHAQSTAHDSSEESVPPMDIFFDPPLEDIVDLIENTVRFEGPQMPEPIPLSGNTAGQSKHLQGSSCREVDSFCRFSKPLLKRKANLVPNKTNKDHKTVQTAALRCNQSEHHVICSSY